MSKKRRLVVATAAESDAPSAEAAREQLCRDYWYPLYAFRRRRGQSPEAATDLTPGFFAERVLKDISPERGKFRSWLLASLQNFVNPERAPADQAWHLHRIYTRRYGAEFCRDALRQPLPHGPTKGAKAGAKFPDW